MTDAEEIQAAGASLREGEVVRGHVIEARLGVGGFGAVYRARQPRTDRVVALKIVPASHARLLERQHRAAVQTLDLNHPGVARVYDVGTLEDGRGFVLMEYVEGSGLGEILEEGPVPVLAALEVARSIGGALNQAHELGLLHRDVAPKNVIVPRRADGSHDFASAKLLDFGIAGALEIEAEAGLTTIPGQVFGTPLYMSPEQFRGEPQTTGTDVYGLGALLFAMLVGRPPFGLRNESTFAVVQATLESAPEFPPEATVPGDLQALVLRCLAKKPAERPSTAELLELLAAPRGFDEPAAGRAAAVQAPSPAPRPVEAARASGSRLWFLVLAVALLAGAAVVWAYLASQGGDGQPILDPPIDPTGSEPSVRVLRLLSGIALILVGVGLGFVVRRFLGSRENELAKRADRVLGGVRHSKTLSQTLAIEVHHLVERCRGRDGQILGATIAMMIDEYEAAQASSDRQQALMNTVDLVDRLHTKASPWYVRKKELIAVAVSLLGIVTGTVEVLRAVLSLGSG